MKKLTGLILDKENLKFNAFPMGNGDIDVSFYSGDKDYATCTMNMKRDEVTNNIVLDDIDVHGYFDKDGNDLECEDVDFDTALFHLSLSNNLVIQFLDKVKEQRVGYTKTLKYASSKPWLSATGNHANFMLYVDEDEYDIDVELHWASNSKLADIVSSSSSEDLESKGIDLDQIVIAVFDEHNTLGEAEGLMKQSYEDDHK